jgi:hypothetical protein
MTHTRITHPRRVALALTGVFVAVLAAVLLAAPSRALILILKPAPLGLVGLTEGQTLRISVANVVGFDPQPDPPRVCALQVGFVDRENNTVGNPHLFELRPGLARSFDFVAIGNPNIRQYVRPVVVDLEPRLECPAVVSGEILDRGGLNGIIIYDSVAFSDPWLSK